MNEALRYVLIGTSIGFALGMAFVYLRDWLEERR